MEVLKLVAVLWRRKGVIGLSTALFVITAVIASVLLPVEYTAETQVMVKSDDSTTSLLNSLGLKTMAQDLSQASTGITDRLYLTTSPPVVNDVIWKLQLRNKGGDLYQAKDVATTSLIAPIFGTPTIVVTQTSGTDVLLIDATCQTPVCAQLMAETVATSYIEQTTGQQRNQVHQAQTFIEAQLKNVEKQLDDAYGNIADNQRQTGVIELDGEVKAAVQRLSTLLMDQDETLAKIEETRARLHSAQEYRNQESSDHISPSTLHENPLVEKLRAALTEAQSQRATFVAQNYTDKAPEMKELDARIASTQEQLKQALDAQATLDPTAQGLQADLAGLEERQTSNQSAIKSTLDQYESYPDEMRKYSQLKLTADAAQSVFKSLQDQQYQIGIAEAMTLSDLRVTSHADLPTSQASPKTWLNLLAGLIVGGLFGCGSALALEYIDDTIRNTEAVRKAWSLPQLGILPVFKTGVGPALLRLAPSDATVEAHRVLRNSLDFASLDKKLQLIAVTSAVPGEGKTTLVVNLAISMANEGRRVLIVDADLRRPALHRAFPTLTSAPGLCEVLVRSAQPQDAIQTTPVANLSVLCAGDLPPNPGHLVESLRMRQVLLELAKSYDVVLLDSPPILAVNDPVVIARVVDAVLVVVEANVTTRRMLVEAKNRFDAAHVTAIGFVLNKVRPNSLSYSRYLSKYGKPAAKLAARAGES